MLSTKLGRQLLKLGIIMGLVGLQTPAFAYYCSHKNVGGFAQIGDTTDKVEQQCGTPNRIETCTHQLTQITNTTYNSNVSYTINNKYSTINPTTSTNPTSTLGRTVYITVWVYDKGPNLPPVLMEFHNGRLFNAPISQDNNPCSNG
ncbi:MAG: DUF2845 domain-containing protein [Gammaproteobacteria bacterium]